MSPLVRLAIELLEDPAAPPGLKAVAGAALLTATSTGVEVPATAPITLWRWLLHSGAGTAALHLHELSDPDVARDAVRILTADADAGEDARDMAIAVLRGENLGVVTDADIVLLAETAIDEGRTRRFTFLIEGVHELRGLAPDFLRILRDRLAAAEKAVVRAAALDVAGLILRLDSEFIQRMLTDISPGVRRTSLEHLERVETLDRPIAAAIVRRHLASEHHRSVIAVGLTTLGSLVRQERGGEN